MIPAMNRRAKTTQASRRPHGPGRLDRQPQHTIASDLTGLELGGNTMSTETELMELEYAARRLIAHYDATGHFVSDSRAALICGVNLRNLTHTLDPAVFHGKLRRVRATNQASWATGSPSTNAPREPQNGTATPQTHDSQYHRSQ